MHMGTKYGASREWSILVVGLRVLVLLHFWRHDVCRELEMETGPHTPRLPDCWWKRPPAFSHLAVGSGSLYLWGQAGDIATSGRIRFHRHGTHDNPLHI